MNIDEHCLCPECLTPMSVTVPAVITPGESFDSDVLAYDSGDLEDGNQWHCDGCGKIGLPLDNEASTAEIDRLNKSRALLATIDRINEGSPPITLHPIGTKLWITDRVTVFTDGVVSVVDYKTESGSESHNVFICRVVERPDTTKFRAYNGTQFGLGSLVYVREGEYQLNST